MEDSSNTKIEILEEDDLKLKFILRSSTAFANSLRRAMKSLVPTMAVDYIDFYMNTSYLYDEILAHRIGLVPIKTDLEKFNLPDKCVCGGEGCPNCQVSFRLNIEGPKLVYSGDFVSDDPETVPVYDNIPIVELDEGQQLMLEAVARLGIGKEHVKWQPVSSCTYKIIPEITIDEKCNSCKNCVEVCPRNVFEVEDGKISVKRPENCSMCMECVQVCEQSGIEVKETNNFLFSVEGTGALPVKKVLVEALKALKAKAEEFTSIVEIE
ncbi:DNA-directed RNA polymerase subunit D [Archaeoglobales archaeon]|nr:MAG: DNA-directed RNA polymerase subunit D [Archaeoglobales archaeon]